MEFLRIAKKLGNSAGVLLPKELLGSEVKITLLNKPINIKKYVFRLIENYTEDILGIYLINKKPPEVLALSTRTKKLIKRNIKISIVPLDVIKRDIKGNFALRKKIISAETILNKTLLEEIKKEAEI